MSTPHADPHAPGRRDPDRPHPEEPLKKHGDRFEEQIPRDDPDRARRREQREDDRSTLGG